MKLYIKEKVFSWRDTFTVKDDQDQDCFFVKGEFSLGKKLHIYNRQGEEVAFIREKLLSFMPRFFVDIDGQEAFRIAQRFTLLRQRYDLEGLPWHVEGDIWAHEYTLYDHDREIMQPSKHWFTWGDSYELSIENPAHALACLCVVLAIDAAVEASSTSSSGSFSN